MGFFLTRLEEREFGSQAELGLSLWVRGMICYHMTTQKLSPPEAHWWAFGGFCVHTPCENEFVPIEDSQATSVKKCFSSLFPIR